MDRIQLVAVVSALVLDVMVLAAMIARISSDREHAISKRRGHDRRG